MLNPIGALRHALVGVSVLAAPGLVMAGVLGGGTHEERFDAKQVLVIPAGDGVRIREVVDQDFGVAERRGYERIIPNDFGSATDVQASSPDAPDAVSVDDFGSETRIRIGDPDTTISGQHRYVLGYTLPEARLSTGELALDIIGTEEVFETGRFEVVLAGFELADPTCNVGSFGAVGGCTLTRDDDVYRVVLEPLKPGQGITVGGTIVSTSAPADVPEPPIPARRGDDRVPLALGAAGLGALAAVGGFGAARRLGRNEVGGTGAADAAYAANGDAVRLVTDDDLDEMVTTEFAPPTGLRPWQGSLLLRERVDNESVSAWFSDMIAQEVLELRGTDPQVLAAGPKLAQADPTTRDRVRELLGGDEQLALGSYQPSLAAVWKQVHEEQAVVGRTSGWWTKFAPGTTPRFPTGLSLVVGGLAAVVGLAVWAGLVRSWPVALVAALVVPALVAGSAYRPLLPVRSAAGTAAALRTESFRRFLQASEGRHVDWAWQHGLLREYSAWAVALGAADAWGRAVANSTVPPAQAAAFTTPLLVHTGAGDWNSARTQPAPAGGGSSSGFGGGFSGGSVGGGGGGGSSGSW